MQIDSVKKDHENIEFFPTALLMETGLIGVDRPIALHLTLNPNTKCAWWGDTTRGHGITFTTYEVSKERVIIKDKEGNSWTFTPLTLELFNTKAKQHLTPLKKHFTCDEEVQTFYSETLF